jgi:CheY-like chemotaxis protein
VEDDFLIAEDLHELIERDGGQVAGTAVTSEQALAMVETKAIDVALLDILLSGGKSGAVAHALRRRGVPFVVATGYGQEAIPEEMRDAPILHKPFSRKDLVDRLRRSLAAAEPGRTP